MLVSASKSLFPTQKTHKTQQTNSSLFVSLRLSIYVNNCLKVNIDTIEILGSALRDCTSVVFLLCIHTCSNIITMSSYTTKRFCFFYIESSCIHLQFTSIWFEFHSKAGLTKTSFTLKSVTQQYSAIKIEEESCSLVIALSVCCRSSSAEITFL